MPDSSKVLIITGASRGIGAATARLAATRGYRVCVNYLRQQPAAENVVAAIRENNGTATAIQADVSSEADVRRLFDETTAELGPVTALVNNAGIVERQSRLDALDAARLQRIFATNVFASFLCCREAVRRMSTRYGGNGGAIVNLSSAASRIGSPHEYIDYAASKGAIDTMTLGLSKEVAEEKIRVNAVRPGIIHGDSRLGRRAQPCGENESNHPDAPGRPARRGSPSHPVATLRRSQLRNRHNP